MLLCLCKVFANSGSEQHYHRMKIQTYGGSVVVPDTGKVKRVEAERSKADLFLEPLVCKMRADGFIEKLTSECFCCHRSDSCFGR